MSYDRLEHRSDYDRPEAVGSEAPTPGRRTLTETLPARKPTDAHAIAESGFQGAGGTLPYADRIQASFGRHDVSGIQAHVGGAAAEAAERLGAEAYASGNSVAFAGAPDLHTAAHEAAHVVQQRAGVQLLGGVGEVGDAYERHADAVADAVVRGESAEGLLDVVPGGGTCGLPVQRKIARPTPLVQLRGKASASNGGAPAESGKPDSHGAGEAAAATGKVARLYFLVDVDVKELGLKDLTEGNVGHTWISIEYIDPHAVPDSVHAKHKDLLKRPGRYADPMGFWPDIQNNVYYSANPFKSWVQGWMRHPDRAHEGAEKAVQVWELTQEEVDAVIAYAESKRGAMYSVYFFNCTTFAKEAVEAAGKSAPSSSRFGICFPNAAYEGIKARQAKKEGHTEVTDLDSGATTEVRGSEGKGG